MPWHEVVGKAKINRSGFYGHALLPVDSETGLIKSWSGKIRYPPFLKGKMKTTKAKRKVMAKVMYEAGWGAKVLKQWFDPKALSPRNIANWAKKPTPEGLKAFEETFRLAMQDADREASFKVKNRIMNLVPEETDINKLVKAGEFFQGQSIKRQTNTQVNVYSDMLKEYGEGISNSTLKIISGNDKNK